MPAGEKLGGWQGTTARSAVSMEYPFITWGHKAIDSLLEEMTDRLQAYGSCVRRLSVPLAEGEAVSYLVATEQGPVQVTSYEMLSQVKPAQIPLTEAEMKSLGINTGSVTVDFEVGDSVTVVAGIWKDTVGQVTKIDLGKQTTTIKVEMFGSDVPVEISFAEVRKLG